VALIAAANEEDLRLIFLARVVIAKFVIICSTHETSFAISGSEVSL
jgi:hypothetical protein